MLVTVGKFLFAYEAHNFASRLRAEGVFAVSQQHGFGYANWSWVLAHGGFRVWVVDAELEATRAVIVKILDGEFQRELEAEFGDLDDVACPTCGSEDFLSRSAYADIAMAILLFPIGVSIPALPRVHRCETCANWWSEKRV
jgi:hypothetical protein